MRILLLADTKNSDTLALRDVLVANTCGVVLCDPKDKWDFHLELEIDGIVVDLDSDECDVDIVKAAVEKTSTLPVIALEKDLKHAALVRSGEVDASLHLNKNKGLEYLASSIIDELSPSIAFEPVAPS